MSVNKYQEALDRVLNHVNLKVVINDEHGLPKIWRDNQGYQDLELMQKLVDKETPMKLTNIRPCVSEEGVVWGNCKCGNEIDYIKYLRDVNYCSNCGQKLDWDNNEKE